MMSLRGAKRRGKPFLNFVIILFLSTAPCQAAIEFDGVNDYIEIIDSSSIKPSQISVSMWFYRNSILGLWDAPLIKTTSTGWVDGFGFTAASSVGNPMRFWVNHYNNAFTTTIIPIGSWVHIVGTYDLTQVNLFQNGIRIGSTPYSSPIIHSNNSLNIGRPNLGNYPSHGKVDDLRIYNRALSNGEVLALFQSRSKRPSGSLANGLVAHYEMDDDQIGAVAAQAQDSSGNLNHGQFRSFDNLTTALSNDVPAQIGTGHSLKFDGVNDYFSVANHTSLKPIDKITIGYWFKRNPGEKNQLGAFQSSSVANSDYILQVYNDNYIYMSIPNGGSNQYFISTSTTIDTNWNFLYAVYDGTQTGNSNRLKVYLNGVLVPGAYVGTIPAVLNQGTLPIENRYNLNYTQGLMDDARIYNRALTASEISFLYNGSGLDPGTSNLQALWTFDKDSALKDTSGNNNHGVGLGGDSLKYAEGILRR